MNLLQTAAASPAIVAPHRLCVAPMMGHTDRHFRFLLRLLSRHTRLYTEMVTAAALAHGDAERLLAHDPRERPVALQLGGAVARELAAATALAQAHGYDEVNLNVGCPSERVRAGRFGACLMAEPALVAECVAAMREASGIPVTVKTRIGIDEHDDYDFLARFVAAVAAAGCATIIVHARKAWLAGLSPRENRELPPLMRGRVHRLKVDFPELEVVVNGGIVSLDEAARELERVDGAMIGRAVCRDPWLLAGADQRLFGDPAPPPARIDVALAYCAYAEREHARGTPIAALARPLLGLFQGRPGARAWRRRLSEQALRRTGGVAVIRDALSVMRESRCADAPGSAARAADDRESAIAHHAQAAARR